MLFSKNDNAKTKKKKAGPTLALWGLASVGAYAIVSTVKKKMCKMADCMQKWLHKKPETGCSCGSDECVPDESAYL